MTRATYVTRLYRPTKIIPQSARETPKDDAALSAKLLVEEGIIKPGNVNGTWTWLPVGIRSLNKLKSIINKAMFNHLGAQEVSLPTLTSSALWRQSGRLGSEAYPPEIMKLKDRHSKELILSPTCEEAICDLVKGGGAAVSSKTLPLRLFQTTEKFRDEARPRGGLLRSRSFLMKDLYTFDVSRNCAEVTYKAVMDAYESILCQLNVPWVKAKGGTGTIGGDLSHEFHILSEVGEDSLVKCNGCKEVFNIELIPQNTTIGYKKPADDKVDVLQNSNLKCPTCEGKLGEEQTAIEVAHAFLLGTKYSSPMKLNLTEHGVIKPIEMGCYGVGISRLIAASVEVLSSTKQLRWPIAIAPFRVAVLPPKSGSKEESVGNDTANSLIEALDSIGLGDDVLVDDRITETLGKRLVDAQKLGIPFIIVCGRKSPEVELHDLIAGDVMSMPLNQAIQMVDGKNNNVIAAKKLNAM